MQKKDLRKHFRDSVLKRDSYKCVICDFGFIEHLEVHHITDRNEIPNGGYVLENGITLCPGCHLKAEKYHMTNGRKATKFMNPTQLYEKIHSSKQLAFRKSRQLEIK